ncbi:hypothetical protein PENTCL1PPCAC_9921 [Pristionchus entomophagus]|uniref:Ankyrin repeat-containing protein n=1 Tax=Pristionchus entomophagus TaxID=358040 RepID=A0AAV5SWN0_9BILA|nr:hypothetical protein PENTCL1PPCAC_9921 [Pristionchus entomophagus]
MDYSETAKFLRRQSQSTDTDGGSDSDSGFETDAPLDQATLQRQLADKITNYASVDEIRMLLVAGAKASTPVVRGLSPLHYACFINYFAAAKLLLVRGAKADAVDDIGCSPLHLCAEHGHFRMMKLLLQYIDEVRQYEKVVKPEKGTRYPIRETVEEPLHLAIKNGHYECARLLLENGADPNAIYFDGPQICMVSPLDTNFIRLLLEFGADPNVFDRKGLTPIMKACRMKNRGIDTIEILLEHGADVNQQAEARADNRTALHYAVLSGNHELVKFLIKNHAELNMPEDYGKPSVLDIAVLKDDPALLQIIIDAGASPHAVHTHIGTPLHLACCSLLDNQYDIIKRLMDAGSDCNMQHAFDDGATIKSPMVEYFRSRDKIDPVIVSLFTAYGGRVIMKSPLQDSRGQLRNIMRLAVNKQQPEIVENMLALGEEHDLSAIERISFPEDLKKVILERARSPPTLQNMIRLQIRRTLKPFTPDRIIALGLPRDVTAHLLGWIN